MADSSQFLNETGTLEKMANKVTKKELEDSHYSKKSYFGAPDEYQKGSNPLDSSVFSGKSFRSLTRNDDLNKTFTVVPDECQKGPDNSNSPILSGKRFRSSTGSDELNKTYTVTPDECQKDPNHLNKNGYEGEKDGIKIIDTLSRAEIEERINTLLCILSLTLSFVLLALILSISIMLPKEPRIVEPKLTKLNGEYESLFLHYCLYLFLYILTLNPSYWISCAISWNFDRKKFSINNYHTYVRL